MSELQCDGVSLLDPLAESSWSRVVPRGCQRGPLPLLLTRANRIVTSEGWLHRCFMRLEIDFHFLMFPGPAGHFNLTFFPLANDLLVPDSPGYHGLSAAMPANSFPSISLDGVFSIPFSHLYLCRYSDVFACLFLCVRVQRECNRMQAVWVSKMFRLLMSVLSNSAFWDSWFVWNTPRL